MLCDPDAALSALSLFRFVDSRVRTVLLLQVQPHQQDEREPHCRISVILMVLKLPVLIGPDWYTGGCKLIDCEYCGGTPESIRTYGDGPPEKPGCIDTESVRP